MSCANLYDDDDARSDAVTPLRGPYDPMMPSPHRRNHLIPVIRGSYTMTEGLVAYWHYIGLT